MPGRRESGDDVQRCPHLGDGGHYRYSDLRKPSQAGAFRQVRALAALACLVINVVTI
jgi:hypothetical protein